MEGKDPAVAATDELRSARVDALEQAGGRIVDVRIGHGESEHVSVQTRGDIVHLAFVVGHGPLDGAGERVQGAQHRHVVIVFQILDDEQRDRVGVHRQDTGFIQQNGHDRIGRRGAARGTDVVFDNSGDRVDRLDARQRIRQQLPRQASVGRYREKVRSLGQLHRSDVRIQHADRTSGQIGQVAIGKRN